MSSSLSMYTDEADDAHRLPNPGYTTTCRISSIAILTGLDQLDQQSQIHCCFLSVLLFFLFFLSFFFLLQYLPLIITYPSPSLLSSFAPLFLHPLPALDTLCPPA